MVLSVPEPAVRFTGVGWAHSAGASARPPNQNFELNWREHGTRPCDGMPNDVLVVEDDPIIALDFEDTLLGFGVKTVRTAANVAKALELIALRPRNSRCSTSASFAKKVLPLPNGWTR
jgi:hypothetical protein